MASFTYFNLIEASRQPGCPVCSLTRQSVEHFLENLFYENVNDVNLRRQLRRSLGFCNTHTWEVIEGNLGDPLGVSIIYHDILSNVLRKMPEKGKSQAPSAGRLSRLGRLPRQLSEKIKIAIAALTPQEACPACEQSRSTSELLLSVLLENLQKEELAAAFESSNGLCWPHLHQAFARVKEEQTFLVLLSVSQKKLAALDAELTEIIRKNDYRFRAEDFGPERDAWRRVLGIASGGKDSSAPH